MIPLSDGQSTNIIFHSPTANGPRIKNNDLLVAFQFLLNKRDVTHVVAPIGGRDVTLNQVCQVLSNLIERNSGKFKKAQEKQDKLRSDIQAIQLLTSILARESCDMGQLCEARSQVRSAVSSLQNTGRFEENESLVNGTARHLSDLLIASRRTEVQRDIKRT